MAKSGVQISGLADENLHLKFFNEQFSDRIKLALLDFLVQEFNLKQPLILKGSDSSVVLQFAVKQYIHQQVRTDLVYLDTDILYSSHFSQITQLWDLVSHKGIVCIESNDTSGVIDVNTFSVAGFETILTCSGFSVFARHNGKRPLRSMRYQIDLFCRKLYFEHVCRMKLAAENQNPEVVVIVLTYKHEDFIAECLQSILRQKGQFRMRIVIIDDASPDGTARIVRSIIAKNCDDHIEIDFQINTHNIGVVRNLATALRKANGCDYLTFCEGDDFWSSDYRIQEHIDFLKNRPDAVMSFNTIELCAADGSSRRAFVDHINLVAENISGIQLAENNVIGNFTACFYRGGLVDVIPQEIFELYTVDWMFNLYCAQFGPIAHLKKPLSIYRQHSGSEWSARQDQERIVALLGYIARYNAFIDYNYDAGFQLYNQRLYAFLDKWYAESAEKLDLIVFDDVFPSVRSGFRYIEFTAYLRTFPSSLVLTSGVSLPVLEETLITKVVRDYQRRHPELGNQVMISTDSFPLRLGKLIYVNFLTNAFAMLFDIEAANVPFVFTLYPGSGFVLNNPECDRKLRRVFDSFCFQRVIVTQQVTYDYIVHHSLCPAEKIQMIFGVVMAEIPENHLLLAKRRWGFDKPHLDICFMAHKYTPYGEDKGYDVFINVVSILSQHYDDIHFHVVGPFDRRVIDVSSFSERITFYGSLDPREFDGFFQNMDIILSPNISGRIFPGSFDGFPTASCIEAGLRGVAIFATDEFNSAKGHFTDGEDIVLIKYDLADIVDQIERYYMDPEALKKIGECGRYRIRELYSYEAQMIPRIKLLREVMGDIAALRTDLKDPMPGLSAADISQADLRQQRSIVWNWLHRFCPEVVKQIYRGWKKSNVSQ